MLFLLNFLVQQSSCQPFSFLITLWEKISSQYPSLFLYTFIVVLKCILPQNKFIHRLVGGPSSTNIRLILVLQAKVQDKFQCVIAVPVSGIPENIRLYEGGGQISTDWLITTEDSCRLITDSKTSLRWMDKWLWNEMFWKKYSLKKYKFLS